MTRLNAFIITILFMFCAATLPADPPRGFSEYPWKQGSAEKAVDLELTAWVYQHILPSTGEIQELAELICSASGEEFLVATERYFDSPKEVEVHRDHWADMLVFTTNRALLRHVLVNYRTVQRDVLRAAAQNPSLGVEVVDGLADPRWVEGRCYSVWEYVIVNSALSAQRAEDIYDKLRRTTCDGVPILGYAFYGETRHDTVLQRALKGGDITPEYLGDIFGNPHASFESKRMARQLAGSIADATR